LGGIVKYLPATGRLTAEDAAAVYGPREALGGDLRVKVGRYLLESSNLQAASPGPDRFNPALEDAVPEGVCTDGEWAWTMDWGYYVLSYGFAPPAEFLEHVQARGAEPVTLEHPELIAALDEFREDSRTRRAFYPEQDGSEQPT
jgi:hypothetical protein